MQRADLGSRGGVRAIGLERVERPRARQVDDERAGIQRGSERRGRLLEHGVRRRDDHELGTPRRPPTVARRGHAEARGDARGVDGASARAAGDRDRRATRVRAGRRARLVPARPGPTSANVRAGSESLTLLFDPFAPAHWGAGLRVLRDAQC